MYCTGVLFIENQSYFDEYTVRCEYFLFSIVQSVMLMRFWLRSDTRNTEAKGWEELCPRFQILVVKIGRGLKLERVCILLMLYKFIFYYFSKVQLPHWWWKPFDISLVLLYDWSPGSCCHCIVLPVPISLMVCLLVNQPTIGCYYRSLLSTDRTSDRSWKFLYVNLRKPVWMFTSRYLLSTYI